MPPYYARYTLGGVHTPPYYAQYTTLGTPTTLSGMLSVLHVRTSGGREALGSSWEKPLGRRLLCASKPLKC